MIRAFVWVYFIVRILLVHQFTKAKRIYTASLSQAEFVLAYNLAAYHHTI